MPHRLPYNDDSTRWISADFSGRGIALRPGVVNWQGSRKLVSVCEANRVPLGKFSEALFLAASLCRELFVFVKSDCGSRSLEEVACSDSMADVWTDSEDLLPVEELFRFHGTCSEELQSVEV